MSRPASAAPAGPAGMGDVEVLRRAWPDVLQALSKIKRSTWALVEPNAQVSAYDGSVLTLAFTTSGLAGAFGRADHSDNLRRAISQAVGIDCQINAVAAGASQASAEPNPKAPASQVAPATSADVAWGLAPAPVATPGTQSAHSGNDAATVQPSPAGSSAVPSSGGAGTAAQGGSKTELHGPQDPAPHSAQPSPAPRSGADVPSGRNNATSGTDGNDGADKLRAEAASADSASGTNAAVSSDPYPPLAGDYSYSDDDWGAPRDEDAPPLEEEPPMDWTPSTRKAGTAPAAPAPSSPPTPQSSPAVITPAPQSAGGAADAIHDPWTRAVEQAPGVWVVGSESNVGTAPAPAGSGGNPESPSVAGGAASVHSTPHYEPATAQVPPSIPAHAVGSAAPTPNAGPAPVVSEREAATAPTAAETQHVREYAMASSAPAPAQAPAQAPAPAAATRQSLYQRLSNSPEAEAGRAKAPARAAAAAATYVQDVPSADDETIEESGVFGRAAVERILGGKLIEERSPDGSPIGPRY